ncbi:MAG: hypothetical protein IJS53_04390 [Clostridia bacterium]|nr:hypothetical protein [Clostridia bacterium]
MQPFYINQPALDRSEAAMLPAMARTLSGGAALRMLPRGDAVQSAPVPRDAEKPAAQPDAAMERMRAVRRAAYRLVSARRFG